MRRGGHRRRRRRLREPIGRNPAVDWEVRDGKVEKLVCGELADLLMEPQIPDGVSVVLGDPEGFKTSGIGAGDGCWHILVGDEH